MTRVTGYEPQDGIRGVTHQNNHLSKRATYLYVDNEVVRRCARRGRMLVAAVFGSVRFSGSFELPVRIILHTNGRASAF